MRNSKEELIEAERKAAKLFEEIESRGLIYPGKTEKTLNEEVYELAYELFEISKNWHKRVVRAGKNTMHPYYENPPDLMINDDDILFFDFGPIFEEWEADFRRTYVMGSNPDKLKLKKDIENAWKESKLFFDHHTSITGGEMYRYTVHLARKYGWEFGGEMAGHTIGNYPHEQLSRELKANYIHPDNDQDMFLPDQKGNRREWLLHIHFVDRKKQIGGFVERLLTA